MLILFLASLIVLAALVGVSFLLGFRLGGERGASELARVEVESARAGRDLYDLTRQAFVAMTEHAARERSQAPRGDGE